MNTFVVRIYAGEMRIQVKYEAIEYIGEDRHFWLFKAVEIARKINDIVTDTDKADARVWAFPKRDEEGLENLPPRFYNELRNKAIDERSVPVQGDDLDEHYRPRRSPEQYEIPRKDWD